VLRVEGDYKPRLIRKALNDASPAVLALAVGAVDSSMGPEVTSRLQDLLATSTSADVREAAANMLGKISAQTSAPALMAALDDPAENVRWFAVEGLRKLGAVQAVPRICELLQKDPSARVREIAASTLGELGQPAGVPALRVALTDANDRVRQKATTALLALATGDYERMTVIAGAFRENNMDAQARQVLENIVKTYHDDQSMKARVADTYKTLAEVELEMKDYAAAAATYQVLDAFAGGSPDVRKALVGTYLQAGSTPPDR
jgi:HEAT repeat protein